MLPLSARVCTALSGLSVLVSCDCDAGVCNSIRCVIRCVPPRVVYYIHRGIFLAAHEKVALEVEKGTR